MKQIEGLLREKMGLDAASIGSGLIHRIVRLRMKTLGLKQVEEYRKLLASSRGEWNELVEGVVVTETWFFRDREPFGALVRQVLEAWLPAHPTAPLRLLSLPCSSGEEPYSAAMALLDAGVPSGRFQIDGADISGRALERARQGIYRKNSFRGEELGFRDRYFHASKEGFVLKPEIRHGVNFYEWNVVTEDVPFNRGPYDFIFCRNLLIYFDRATQERALRRIERMLSPSGMLFVGPAEMPLVLDHGFVSAGIPMAFACRRANAPGEQRLKTPARIIVQPMPGVGPFSGAATGDLGSGFERPSIPQPLGIAAPGDLPVGHRRTPPPRRENLPGAAPASRARALSADGSLKAELQLLQTARRHADAGRLKEAAALCERHLQEFGAAAEAYYLLGLVLDAQSDCNAIECYRKALYLEPNHYETLLQMAVLSQRTGDASRADQYKRRAKRAAVESLDR
jgi:chemotaxis protein methyltransferase WspC